MTIEQIELRKMLTQMLADNGINRETIVDFVKSIVEKKWRRLFTVLYMKLILMAWFAELYGRPQRRLYRRRSLKRCGQLYPLYRLALNAMSRYRIYAKLVIYTNALNAVGNFLLI